jgi:hypothetical protein
MPGPPTVRRSLSQARAAWRDAAARARMIARSLSRTARLQAAAAGLRPREHALLQAGDGRNASGLFSEVASVLGFLDHFEQWRRAYEGVTIDFSRGLYLDPEAGPDWWRYYFEPVAAGNASTPMTRVDQAFHDLCANRVERHLSRGRGAALVARYVTPAPKIRDIADAFARRHWAGGDVIGVHYRGTDKSLDAPRVDYDDVEQRVRERLGEAGSNCKVFVATDEQDFIEFMRNRFHGSLTCQDMFRSTDGRAIDVVNPDGNYLKGLHAVVDCVLLARTNLLIRTASNLSLIATFMNVDLPVVMLNQER